MVHMPVKACLDAAHLCGLPSRLEIMRPKSKSPPKARTKAKPIKVRTGENTPFYGIEGQGWFLGFHTFTHYVKVTFFRGTSLRPVPPGASKDKNTRYLDIHEGDELDGAQMAAWVKQAAAVPGWVP